MVIEQPASIFDRAHEWTDLTSFVEDNSPGLRIGAVRGRRRHGKSYLLEHLCRAVGGVYTLALRQSRVMALNRFADSLSDELDLRVGRFDNWVDALDAAVDLVSRVSRGGVPLLVVDEFPYLVAHSPELPSAIQALYDQRAPATGHPPFKLALCGSSISVMSTLLSGDQALYGRAVLDLRVGPFHYRDAAAYWDSDPDVAFVIDAVLGGAPGYRDVVGGPPEPGPVGLFDWLERTLLNPSHVLFTEPDYLLAEDPTIGDRAVYHAIWEAVSGGATTPTQIGGVVGMDAKSLTYHLDIMKDGGFLRYDQDVLLQRRPVITVADPAVRFNDLIVRPNLLDLELRRAAAAWDRSQATFAAQVIGPHFESLAREWTARFGHEAGLDDVGHVGRTVVACREHRGHEVDVVALGRRSRPRTPNAQITLLGEAKATNNLPDVSQLRRLEHIRDVLVGAGRDAANADLAVFSRSGFSEATLAAAACREDLHLLDLAAMYGTGGS